MQRNKLYLTNFDSDKYIETSLLGTLLSTRKKTKNLNKREEKPTLTVKCKWQLVSDVNLLVANNTMKNFFKIHLSHPKREEKFDS